MGPAKGALVGARAKLVGSSGERRGLGEKKEVVKLHGGEVSCGGVDSCYKRRRLWRRFPQRNLGSRPHGLVTGFTRYHSTTCLRLQGSITFSFVPTSAPHSRVIVLRLQSRPLALMRRRRRLHMHCILSRITCGPRYRGIEEDKQGKVPILYDAYGGRRVEYDTYSTAPKQKSS